MVNTDKLMGAVFARGLNKSKFAQKLGRNGSWLSERLKKRNFTIGDADAIVEALNLSKAEATDIFFSQFVA